MANFAAVLGFWTCAAASVLIIAPGRVETGNHQWPGRSLQAERRSPGSGPRAGGWPGRGCALTAVFLQELNERWRSLQQLAEERSQLLGSAHEVQRFHR